MENLWIAREHISKEICSLSTNHQEEERFNLFSSSSTTPDYRALFLTFLLMANLVRSGDMQARKFFHLPHAEAVFVLIVQY